MRNFNFVFRNSGAEKSKQRNIYQIWTPIAPKLAGRIENRQRQIKDPSGHKSLPPNSPKTPFLHTLMNYIPIFQMFFLPIVTKPLQL